MKATSFLCLIFLAAIVVGCSEPERKTATDGADAQAILDYEAAVAAAEGQSLDADMEATSDDE